MSHVVNRVMSGVMDLVVDHRVVMELGMLDMGVDPHDLSGRRESDGSG